MARVLGAVRLSRETEPTSSPDRQRDHIRGYADSHGHEVVGYAEDLGVSASVDPFKRPDLGAWLRGEREPFDLIVSWRVDRVARRVLHFAKLLEWCQEHNKTFASATEPIDLSTTTGRMFAQIIAVLAEGELEAMRERASDSYRKLQETGRWRGGVVPFGYVPVERPEGGYRLEVDPDGAALIRDLASRLLGGTSMNQLVTELNQTGVMTSLDRQRVRSGKPARGSKWRVRTLTRTMRSDTLRGYVDPNNGDEFTDEHGHRVQRAEPILDEKTWKQVQLKLDERATNLGERPHRKSAMLRRVAFCVCGEPMYIGRARKERRYYRCATRISGTSCGRRAVLADWLEEFVSDNVLERFGDMEMTRRVFVPGESHAEEIESVERALQRLTERLERVDGPAADTVLARMQEQSSRLSELRQLPERPDTYEHETTGQTFAEYWQQLDLTARGNLLRDAGVRANVASSPTTEPEHVVVVTVNADEWDRAGMVAAIQRSGEM